MIPVHVDQAKNTSRVMANFENKHIDVAVGVVFNKSYEVLITQRSEDSPYPNLWELPGGKVKKNELPSQAVVRELKEELGILCLEIMPFMNHQHQYPDLEVMLHVFIVTAYNGQPERLEHQQDLSWVNFSDLSGYTFPEGNLPILQRLMALSVTGIADLGFDFF